MRKLVKEAARADWLVGNDPAAGIGAENVVMVVALLVSLAIGIAGERSDAFSLKKSRRI